MINFCYIILITRRRRNVLLLVVIYLNEIKTTKTENTIQQTNNRILIKTLIIFIIYNFSNKYFKNILNNTTTKFSYLFCCCCCCCWCTCFLLLQLAFILFSNFNLNLNKKKIIVYCVENY